MIFIVKYYDRIVILLIEKNQCDKDGKKQIIISR